MRIKNILAPLIISIATMNFAFASRPAPETIDYLDIPRYMGKWYEIARLPNSFQKGCKKTTATYRLRKDGRVDVLNECNKGKRRKSRARGLAKVMDLQTNAKLSVSFVPILRRWNIFAGDYWVVGPQNFDYSVSLVTNATRNVFWILSRTPQISKARLQDLIDEANDLGIDTKRLIFSQNFR